MSTNETQDDVQDEGSRKRPHADENEADEDSGRRLEDAKKKEKSSEPTNKQLRSDQDRSIAREDDAHALYDAFHVAQKNLVEIRRRIHSRGLYAPDCLLHYLPSGDDGSPILSAIFQYLSFEDVGRCEMTCKFFQKQAKLGYWPRMLQTLVAKSPNCRSPSAVAENDPRKIMIRYHLASALAERIGALGDDIKKHVFTFRRFGFSADEYEDGRVHGACDGDGCAFPDMLDFGIFRAEDKYEIYVRFSRTLDNSLFADGFLPFEIGDNLVIPLGGLDVSKWTAMVELMKNGAGAETLDEDLLDSCMRELTATIVAVNKTRLEATLVAAQCNFAGEEDGGLSGIDAMEGHGFCWPFGTLAARSHGDLCTVRKFCRGLGGSNVGYFTRETRYSSVNIGMNYHTRYYPENKEETREWIWQLECCYGLRDD